MTDPLKQLTSRNKKYQENLDSVKEDGSIAKQSRMPSTDPKINLGLTTRSNRRNNQRTSQRKYPNSDRGPTSNRPNPPKAKPS